MYFLSSIFCFQAQAEALEAIEEPEEQEKFARDFVNETVQLLNILLDDEVWSNTVNKYI